MAEASKPDETAVDASAVQIVDLLLLILVLVMVGGTSLLVTLRLEPIYKDLGIGLPWITEMAIRPMVQSAIAVVLLTAILVRWRIAVIIGWLLYVVIMLVALFLPLTMSYHGGRVHYF